MRARRHERKMERAERDGESIVTGVKEMSGVGNMGRKAEGTETRRVYGGRERENNKRFGS